MVEIDISAITAEFTSDSDTRADQAARELANLGSQNPEVFSQLLADSRMDVRWWTVRSLAGIDSPDAQSMIIHALDDPDIPVRQCAALALHQHPVPQAIPGLVQTLGSADPLLRRLAGDALIAAGSDAVPELIAVLQDGSQFSRIEAARALALIGDTRAVPALFEALDEESAVMEHWAGEGLERMGIGMVFYSP